MPSAVNAQKSGRHLRNRRDIITSPPEYSVTTTTNNDLRRLSNTQSCILGLEDVMPSFDAPHSSIKDHVFTCVMDPEEEDTTYHPGHMFDLDMDADDEEFLEKLFDDGTIIPGQYKLDVQGLEYDEEKIYIPKSWDIATKISNGTKKSPPWKSNRLRHHAQDNNIYENRNLKTGDRKVLVVKVVTPELRNSTTNQITCTEGDDTYPSTSQRPESPAEISSIIFGEGPTGVANSNVNMKDQLSACSFDKLNMIPTDGDDPINAPGVITLEIEKSLCNHRNRFRDDAKLKLEERLGRPVTEVYDHVIFLMEKCVQNCGWAAFAGSNSWYSFYQNINYKIPAVVMHELGHNFNLAHSGVLDGSKYGDKTGFMGNPAHAPGARYAGNLCYDAAKSWQLGWYNDRDLTLYPENESSTWGTVKTMVGIANYDQATSNTPVLIKLETGLAEDYFINFNRATGINQQNVQADDEVTIVKANADTKSQSYLQATLPENESHTIVGLGKANGIVVKLLSIDKTDPDLWKAEVFIGTDQATLPGPTTPQPTRSPSKSPTLSPSASPSGSPSRSPSTSPTQSPSQAPSVSPSSQPTSSPSQSPSLSPSKGPSKAPQLNPTTASPSTSPSVHPSKAPSDSPSDQPSSQPTTSMPTLSSSSMAPTLSPTTPAPIVTKEPTSSPTSSPSQSPSASPSQSPTSIPSQSPSTAPSKAPTVSPTLAPSRAPSTSPSANPTQSPTTESPTYGSTPVQQHYTACGSSKQSCAGRTDLADAEELHEVRCCSDTDLGNGWNKRSGCDVWGESHINGVCHRGKTYTEAVDICASVGARLCTAQELLDDCPRGTGCNFDREMNWSSTPGIEQEVTEYEYEAEYYSNGSGVSVKTTHAGYTGSGFVDYGGSGTYIEINNVNGGSGGVCSISTNYANGGTWTRRCKVSVNGVDQPGELSYPPTGAWNNWADSNTLQVNCNPGTSNTIRITGITSGPNMNKMMVSVP